MKKYIKSIYEVFGNLSEDEIKNSNNEPSDTEVEDNLEDEELEKDHNIFNIEDSGTNLEFYNDLTDSLVNKLGLKYEGPYSSQEDTIAKIGDKTPLNYKNWNNVYFKVYDESDLNPPLFLEYIVHPDSLDSYMEENGKHWPDTFIYKQLKDKIKLVYTIESKEHGMLNWIKKEFD